MDEQAKHALSHAWEHFRLHAEQRITVFNFFVATASLLVTGLGYTLQASHEFWPLGVAAGALLFVFSLVFGKLDARVSAIIKSSESVIAAAETRVFGNQALRTVQREREMTERTHRGLFGPWTYGRSFRFIFGLMACVGAGGIALSVTRAPIPHIALVWPTAKP